MGKEKIRERRRNQIKFGYKRKHKSKLSNKVNQSLSLIVHLILKTIPFEKY